jgi:hypothetical protein
VDVTPPEELPEGWGLMVPSPRGRRFKVIAKPAERKPELTMSLLLTLLKNTETTRTNAMRYAVDQERERHRKEMDTLRRELRGKADPESASRLQRMDALEEAMGLEVADYTSVWAGLAAPEMAAGLKDFMAGHQARVLAKKATERQAHSLERAAEAMTEQAKKLREALK